MDWLLGLADVDRHLNTDYADFMADMEIYIDGLATMQITTLNSVAQIAKDEITDTFTLLSMRTLIA